MINILLAALLTSVFIFPSAAEPGLYARHILSADGNIDLQIWVESKGDRAIVWGTRQGSRSFHYDLVRENAVWKTYEPKMTPKPAQDEQIRYLPEQKSCQELTEIALDLSIGEKSEILLSKDASGETTAPFVYPYKIEGQDVQGWNERRFYPENCSRMFVVIRTMFVWGYYQEHLYEVGGLHKSER